MPDKTTRAAGFILIVEDDRGTSMLEGQRLEPLGLEIRRAASAEETVGILRAATPELMLLDYSLPGASAVELIAQLRRSAIPVPLFIVVTGRCDEAAAAEIVASGAGDYIIKDRDFLEGLLPAARKALAKAAASGGPEKGKRPGASEAGNRR